MYRKIIITTTIQNSNKMCREVQWAEVPLGVITEIWTYSETFVGSNEIATMVRKHLFYRKIPFYVLYISLLFFVYSEVVTF